MGAFEEMLFRDSLWKLKEARSRVCLCVSQIRVYVSCGVIPAHSLQLLNFVVLVRLSQDYCHGRRFYKTTNT